MKDAAPAAIHLKNYQAPHYLIDRTELRIELYDDYALVSSHLFLKKNSDALGESNALHLDGNQLQLVSIALDDAELAPDQYLLTDTSLVLDGLPEKFQLFIVTKILPQVNTSLEGLYRSGNKFCTQCEAEGFRRITFYLDRPDVMSVFTTTIVGDKERFPILLSNGNAMDHGDAEDGRHWQTWHDPFKKPCYLFALVAGNLVSVDDQFLTHSGRTIELKVYVEAKDIGKCDHAIESLKNAMAWDEKVYGREYDLDLFMIVAVDDFNMGAMENKGINIFNTSCVLADPQITTDAGFQRVEAVVAHEYFHNWSGNRVTCRDWFQLSLKEGFTVFRDSQFSADMGSPTVKRVEDVTLLRTLQFAEDAGPLAHPVQPPSYIEISNFYTLTIYEKGAEVVRMIYNLLGPVLFRQGSDLYFERHDGQAVTIAEFVQAMADVSSKDFSQFKYWYTQAGTPQLDISDNYDAANQTYHLTVKQSCPATPESKQKHPFHIPLAMGLMGKEGELEIEDGQKHCVLEVTASEQQFEFKQIAERPVPSLLRDFSAPVRLHFDYSAEDLKTLATKDSDGFSRWNAMQMLSKQVIDRLMKSYPSHDEQVIDENLAQAFQQLLTTILTTTDQDNAMIALMLQLPSEAYLSEQAHNIDVDAIHHCREYLRKRLAQQHELSLVTVYDRLNQNLPYRADSNQIANRSLKNIALQYLSLIDNADSVQRSVKQFQSANNMTDRFTALQALVNSRAPSAHEYAESCLQEFYQRFEGEPLAIDQWLIVQATAVQPNALKVVKQLCQHPCFSLTNPNKVRSLIAAFCNNNLVNFHQSDGSGYDFLCEQIIELNRLNPQIASRLVTPLTRWRKYDKGRQALMTSRLNAIAEQKDISKDVFEIVSKSLA